MSRIFLIASTATILVLGACAEPKKPAETPAAPTADATADAPTSGAPSTEQAGKSPEQGNLAIDDAIRKACGIDSTKAFFAYNSAAVKAEARAVLKQLADCFSTGPLKGKQMRLVGHTDPRGDESYNQSLGERRAANVKKLIVAEGLADGQVTTVSVGESEATSAETCEAGATSCDAAWAKDRKVEVKLAEG